MKIGVIMFEPMVIGVVINWNGRSIFYKGSSILDRLLIGLEKTDYDNFEIIISDGNSSDDSISIARSFDLKTVKTENTSFADNCNEGILYALKKYPDLKYIVLLNNDLIIKDRLWLKKLVEVAESNDKIGIVGCRLLRPDGTISHGFAYLNIWGIPSNYKMQRPSGYVFAVVGACLMIRREALEKVGMIDEIYQPIFAEDTDICDRVRRAGYKVYFRNDTNIVHLEGYTVMGDKGIKRIWSKKELAFSHPRNILIYLLRYHRIKAFMFLMLKSAQAFLGKRSRGHLFVRRLEEAERNLAILINQFKSAIRMYKVNKNGLDRVKKYTIASNEQY